MIYLNDRLFDFNLDAALAQLSPQRRTQALRFRHELGRRTCAAAYLLLCEGLQKEYGITEQPLFEYGPHGKPFIVGHPDIHFNLSHCREAAICIVDAHPVGIDIESVRMPKDSLVRYTMNEAEQQQIFTSPTPALAFTRLWTMKEAAVKRSGHGLQNDLKTVLTTTDLHIETIESPDGRYVYSVCR